MAKTVTSLKRERSLSAIEPVRLKTRKGLSRFNSKKILSDHEAVGQALMECLKLGFKEILSAYLEVVNKSAFAKRAASLIYSWRTSGRTVLHFCARPK
jgi:hypothetical protein